jgi:catechol 2,3-dioxygenase-like lactoylglutathione lyase family enzyme
LELETLMELRSRPTKKMSRRITTAVAVVTFFGVLSSAHPQIKETAAPVRRIDHIMIRMDDPDKFYAFLTQTLLLPIAWPLATRGGVTSGAVGVGNTNIEAIQFPGQKPSHAKLVGFGFEPSPLGECLDELDRRGITYGEPRPFIVTEQDGRVKTLFTNVTLRQFSDADRPVDATIHIFLSEYSATYVDVEERRARLRRELQDKGGGPLRITGVKEVVVGATDLNAATRLWKKLLEPNPRSAPTLWPVGDGPAIRVVRATENKLQGLIISVRSLPQAKAFLRERGLLGPVTTKRVTIDSSKIQGLNIQLIESR